MTFLTPSTLATLSLSGVVNLLDSRAPEQVTLIHGPQKSITAVGLSGEGKDRSLWVGSYDGGLRNFEDGGEWKEVAGSGHKGQIVGIAAGTNGNVWSASWDDQIKEVSSEGVFT